MSALWKSIRNYKKKTLFENNCNGTTFCPPFYVKIIDRWVPAFFMHNNLFTISVCMYQFLYFFFSSRGIYVQDLNPCNILLNENGELTLTYHCQWISIENPPNPRALNQLYVAPEVCLFLPCFLFINLVLFVLILLFLSYHKNLYFRLSLK